MPVAHRASTAAEAVNADYMRPEIERGCVYPLPSPAAVGDTGSSLSNEAGDETGFLKTRKVYSGLGERPNVPQYMVMTYIYTIEKVLILVGINAAARSEYCFHRLLSILLGHVQAGFYGPQARTLRCRFLSLKLALFKLLSHGNFAGNFAGNLFPA